MFTGQLTIDSYRNDAVDMRYLLERMPNIGNLASYFSSEIDPAAQVSDFSVTGRDPAEGPLSFSIALTAPQFGRSSGDRVTVRLPLPIDAGAITHGLATRRYPMRLEQIGGEQRSYSLRLPHGYEVHIPEPESELNTPFGTFTFAAHLDGNTLQVEWRFVLTQRLITPDEYPAFREFLARCDHVTSQVVTLQPTGPALLMRPPE
jgi:hypothetical protein